MRDHGDPIATCELAVLLDLPGATIQNHASALPLSAPEEAAHPFAADFSASHLRMIFAVTSRAASNPIGLDGGMPLWIPCRASSPKNRGTLSSVENILYIGFASPFSLGYALNSTNVFFDYLKDGGQISEGHIAVPHPNNLFDVLRISGTDKFDGQLKKSVGGIDPVFANGREILSPRSRNWRINKQKLGRWFFLLKPLNSAN